MRLFFASTPHHFLILVSTFNFPQFCGTPETEPNRCSVTIRNIAHSSAILSLGYIGYNEVPVTNIKPQHYKVN